VKKRITVPPNWEDPPKSFERFERLVKGLMAVPKEEAMTAPRPDTRKGHRKKQTLKKVGSKRKRV